MLFWLVVISMYLKKCKIRNNNIIIFFPLHSSLCIISLFSRFGCKSLAIMSRTGQSCESQFKGHSSSDGTKSNKG